MYLTSAFLWFLSVLVFRRINKLRNINPYWEFDSHPGARFLLETKGFNTTKEWGRAGTELLPLWLEKDSKLGLETASSEVVPSAGVYPT